MTDFINFAPSAVSPFQFIATLDGAQYNVIVTWNMFRSSNNSNQGFYVNVYDLSGNLVVSRAVSGSAVGQNLQSLSWANGEATATTVAPHGYKVGSLVALTIGGASPDGFNGLFECYVTGPSTFTYPLATNPGAATAFGSAAYNVNLVGGYFETSWLVYRTPNRQFEVGP